ncbi:hypothetical protein GQ457_14G000610 [Hibiscus cannabinus]
MVNTAEVLDGGDDAVHGNEDAASHMFSNKRIKVCLDDTNYLLWKQHVVLTIRGLGLEEFIDPDTPKPAKFVDRAGERVVNPAYTRFVKQDSSLASWLLSTVSSDVLPQLVGAETSAEIWSVISGLYSKMSTTKIMHLHCKLRSMKKGALRMREYTVKVKEICDLLALSGNKVAEVEHIATILNGLPAEFAPFVAVITASQVPYTLDGVISVLVDAESRLLDVVEAPIGINLSQFQSSESHEKNGFVQSTSNQNRGRGYKTGPYRGGRFLGLSSSKKSAQDVFESEPVPVIPDSQPRVTTDSLSHEPMQATQLSDELREPRESSLVTPAASSIDPVISDSMVNSDSVACSSDSILGSHEEEHATGDIDNTEDSIEIPDVELDIDPVINDSAATEEGTSAAVIPLVLAHENEASSSIAPSSSVNNEQKPTATCAENSFLQLSYQGVVSDGFSIQNLVGSGSFGSVYKGILEESRATTAVKVLNLLNRGASKSFLVECEALKNIQHRNLVKILIVISSVDYKGNDFKALIYEFMVNGSLEGWLHVKP